MRFRPGARLDPSQVEDRRGRGGPIALGGGGLGVAGVVVYLLFALLGGGGAGTFDALDGIIVGPGTGGSGPRSSTARAAPTRTRQDCRILGDVNSVQAYWSGWFRRTGSVRAGATVFFTGATSTLAAAPRPRSRSVLLPGRPAGLHRSRLLRGAAVRFGAQGGPFAQAYVLAHEYGHHVQDLLGDLRPGRQSRAPKQLGPDWNSGRLLRRRVGGARRRHRLHRRPHHQDVSDGLNAAAAVGDDRIQQQTQGQVNPETWTHGSSAERQHWFATGYQRGEPSGCDTFSRSL